MGLITAELHAETEAITWANGYLAFSSNTFTTISGRKHIMKHKKITNIMIVNRRSFLLRKNFNLLLVAGVESNLFNFACCFRTVLNMHEYEIMIMAHGKRNPTRKMNVFGDFPFFLRIVQENVSSAYPSWPHRPTRGKNLNQKWIIIYQYLSTCLFTHHDQERDEPRQK